MPLPVMPFAAFNALCWAIVFVYWATGTGRLDYISEPFGRDFINYWTAGVLANADRTAEIFDPARFLAAERQLYHPDIGFRFWSYPPTMLLFVYPLGWMGYFTAFAVWIMAGFGVLIAPLSALFPDRRAFWLTLLCPAMAVNVFVGQNGAFTAALLLGGLLCRERRPILSGVLFGLLVIKPQLALMIPILVIAERRWTTMVSGTLTVLMLTLLSFLVFGVDAWEGFFRQTLPMQTAFMSSATGFFLAMMPSAFAAGRLMGLGGEAIWLQLPFFLFACVVVWRGCVSRRSLDEKSLLVILGTFVASPQSFTYDLILVQAAAPLLILRHGLIVSGSLLWFLPIMCLPFEIYRIPVAPLILALGLWTLYRITAATNIERTRPQTAPFCSQPLLDVKRPMRD
ncbi:glycosyltransferase family 87 protein [Terrihabitans sp. B22-R8]|uniref:glycosyltransferase family 87 protein n=1 Tax=Terrihabitans sp. B22-R8 TaxID=3425128 RepID=UPI00403CE02B